MHRASIEGTSNSPGHLPVQLVQPSARRLEPGLGAGRAHLPALRLGPAPSGRSRTARTPACRRRGTRARPEAPCAPGGLVPAAATRPDGASTRASSASGRVSVGHVLEHVRGQHEDRGCRREGRCPGGRSEPPPGGHARRSRSRCSRTTSPSPLGTARRAGETSPAPGGPCARSLRTQRQAAGSDLERSSRTPGSVPLRRGRGLRTPRPSHRADGAEHWTGPGRGRAAGSRVRATASSGGRRGVRPTEGPTDTRRDPVSRVGGGVSFHGPGLLGSRGCAARRGRRRWGEMAPDSDLRPRGRATCVAQPGSRARAGRGCR